MHINALVLADSADVVDDRLQITDGAWDGLTALAWPAGHDIQVVTLLAPEAGDVGQALPSVVSVTAPDGSEAGRTEATVRVERLRAQLPVVLPVFAEFAAPGEYRVSVTVAGAALETAFLLDGPPADTRLQPSAG
ncbi:MAG: hypothetical protein JWO60_751 [Frankiales bacterium]|nr:hypothetical protein [Frankiales bacterium]